jgi:hypothetical protein
LLCRAFGTYAASTNFHHLRDTTWNKGGRLYSQGEDSYQRLHKDERLKMLIDGQPVVEIDVTASFLTILHARCGKPLDLSRDPYEIEGLPRSVVKTWVTMTLGHDKFHTRWPREISADYLEEHGKKIGTVHPLRDVQQAVTGRCHCWLGGQTCRSRASISCTLKVRRSSAPFSASCVSATSCV